MKNIVAVERHNFVMMRRGEEMPYLTSVLPDNGDADRSGLVMLQPPHVITIKNASVMQALLCTCPAIGGKFKGFAGT